MKKKGYFIIVVVLLIPILLIAYYYVDRIIDHPFKKEYLYDAFGDSAVSVKVNCNSDFVILTMQGDVFDFYEYSIDSISVKTFLSRNSINEWPNFRYGIFEKNVNASNLRFSRWKQTPISGKDYEIFNDLINFGNLTRSDCSNEFLEKKYNQISGNYFAYFEGYPIGIYIYILVPSENKLFIIRKRG